MALANYTDLLAAVREYLHRSTDITDAILGYWINEVEAEANARLRVRRMLTSVVPTVSAAGVVTLPADFGGWKRFVVFNGSNAWDLKLKDAEARYDDYSAYGASGVPYGLYTEGSTSQIWPFTNAIYTFAALYYARIPNLTSAAPTNWLMTNFPMVYLHGCIAAAKGWNHSDSPKGGSKLNVWQERFFAALDQVEEEDARDRAANTREKMEMDTTLFGGNQPFTIIGG